MTTIGQQIINPNPELRRVQDHVKRELEARKGWPEHDYSSRGRGWIHLQRNLSSKQVVRLDIKRAFESCSYSRVVGLLRSNGLEPCLQLAARTCYNGRLMRGSTCSPIIFSNILRSLDFRVNRLASKLGWNYYRYCDDLFLTPTSDDSYKNKHTLSHVVKLIAQEEGFLLEEKQYKPKS